MPALGRKHSWISRHRLCPQAKRQGVRAAGKDYLPECLRLTIRRKGIRIEFNRWRVEMLFKRIAPLTNVTRPFPGLIMPMLLLCAGLCQPAAGQESIAPNQLPRGQLNAEQIVQNLVSMNLKRAQSLLAYQSTRIYRLEYKGFPGGRIAEMVVNVKYQAPETKEFEVVSATGSKQVIDRVFKKLLQAKKRHSRERTKSASPSIKRTTNSP